MDNPVFQNSKVLGLFFYLLLKSNHKDRRTLFNDKELLVKRGQLVFGRKEASKFLKIKESTIYKHIQVLKNLGIIGIESNNKFSIVTICEYSKYQDTENTKETESNNQVTTKEQPSNTSKELKDTKKNVNKIAEAKPRSVFYPITLHNGDKLSWKDIGWLRKQNHWFKVDEWVARILYRIPKRVERGAWRGYLLAIIKDGSYKRPNLSEERDGTWSKPPFMKNLVRDEFKNMKEVMHNVFK